MEGRDAIWELESAGSGTRFSDIRHRHETGSTNADVMALAQDGAPEGIVVVADHQTAGRGRAGRIWTAPPGASLLCTLLLRPPARVASLVTAALAVAASEAVEDVAGFSPGLKWPNDLVVEGPDDLTRKLAGVLADAAWPAGSHTAAGHRAPAAHERATVAAGIGINVDWPHDLPAELEGIAIACNHVSGRSVDRGVLLGALLRRFDERYTQLTAGDEARVLAAWRGRSTTLGRRIRVDLGADDIEGVAVDITEDGHLVVDTATGGRRTFAVGDVVHLRRSTS